MPQEKRWDFHGSMYQPPIHEPIFREIIFLNADLSDVQSQSNYLSERRTDKFYF